MQNKIAPVIFQHHRNVDDAYVSANIRANAGRNLPNIGYKGVCVCGSGPSLKDSLDVVRKLQKNGFAVASMNGSYNYLLSNNIVPDYFFMIDARESVNLQFIANPHPETTHVIASQCHPEIFEALAGYRVMLWQVDNYEGARQAIVERAPHVTIFGGASNVGQAALGPLMAVGYRMMHLVGFDGPVRSNEPLENAPEQHVINQPQNDAETRVEFFFEGERFVGTGTNAHDANSFVDRAKLIEATGVKIVVHGNNLLQKMYRSRTGSAANKTIPAPIPRKRPVEKLQIVCWKWKGHIHYSGEDVNRLARQFDRFMHEKPFEMVCITDDPEGIDGGIRTIPMWRDKFEHGRDWHRVKIFSEEMADLIGPRFVSVDLDTVLCDYVDPLFYEDVPFKAWRDPFRPHQYCTALFQMDAGAYPFVWSQLDTEFAMKLRASGRYIGYDQIWVSYALPGAPMWTANDGVLSFRKDVLKNADLPESGVVEKPEGAKMVMFHGKYNPRDEDVQRACPWIGQYYL